jgi:hypothetical protein
MASLISHKTHEDAASKGTLTAGRGYRPRRRSLDRRRLPNVLAAIKGREQLRQLRTWGTGKCPGTRQDCVAVSSALSPTLTAKPIPG